MKIDKLFAKKIAGVDIVLNGETFVVAPMNFKTIIALTPVIKTLGDMRPGVMPSKTQLYSIAKIIHKALKRNYPFIRLSTVISGLDMQNMGASLTQVMGGSGAVKQGEAVAGNP